MIAEALVLLLAASAAATDTKVPQPDRKPTHLLQFVGEQLAFDPIDCVPYRWSTEDMSQSQDEAEAEAEDDTDSTRCGGDDLNYMARYRVLKTIKGETGDTVDFIASGWTSFYAESRHALLYVLVSPDGALLPRGWRSRSTPPSMATGRVATMTTVANWLSSPITSCLVAPTA